ncbi:hypothetical protein NB704_000306 [Pantoea ananatis]|nr:hypothetical protein [Pantoea ananatis]
MRAFAAERVTGSAVFFCQDARMFPARVLHPFITRRNGLLHAYFGSRQALPGKVYAHTGIAGRQARLWPKCRPPRVIACKSAR